MLPSLSYLEFLAMKLTQNQVLILFSQGMSPNATSFIR